MVFCFMNSLFVLALWLFNWFTCDNLFRLLPSLHSFLFDLFLVLCLANFLLNLAKQLLNFIEGLLEQSVCLHSHYQLSIFSGLRLADFLDSTTNTTSEFALKELLLLFEV
jgi:hypothetical protein